MIYQNLRIFHKHTYNFFPNKLLSVICCYSCGFVMLEFCFHFFFFCFLVCLFQFPWFYVYMYVKKTKSTSTKLLVHNEDVNVNDIMLSFNFDIHHLSFPKIQILPKVVLLNRYNTETEQKWFICLCGSMTQERRKKNKHTKRKLLRILWIWQAKQWKSAKTKNKNKTLTYKTVSMSNLHAYKNNTTIIR